MLKTNQEHLVLPAHETTVTPDQAMDFIIIILIKAARTQPLAVKLTIWREMLAT